MIASPHAAPSPRPLQAPVLHSSSVRISTTVYRDAESLFIRKPIAEIRNTEAAARKQIEDTKAELRPFVGNLIDSVDSIVPLKASCTSISTTIAEIHGCIKSLSASSRSQSQSQTESRTKLRSQSPAWIYGIACRVKYLVDTLESISGYLDEEMYFEAALRVVIAKYVHRRLFSAEEGDGVGDDRNRKILANFPLLQHQWQIVDMFWEQILRQSRDRLLDRGLAIAAYADALAAVAVIDELEPKQVLSLFLESMNSWILQVLGNAGAGDASSSVSCDVLGIIQVSVCQLDELFFKGFNDKPLFYEVILGSPTASQLFARIPNPDEEVRLWKSFRDKLESTMVMLDEQCIAGFTWLRECVKKISERNLIDATGNGRDLASAEKSREIMESKQVLERNLILKDDSNLQDEIFEEAFFGWMKGIIDFRFRELTVSVDVVNLIPTVGNSFANPNDVQGYLNRPSMAGGVWFVESNSRKTGVASGFKVQPEESEHQTCLNAYFGPEVCQIQDAIDVSCQRILEDLLMFSEPLKSSGRLKDLAPYLQSKYYDSVSSILTALEKELDCLYGSLEKGNKEVPTTVTVEKSLFIGRLLSALQNDKHIHLLLGFPRFCISGNAPGVQKLPSLVKQARLESDSSICDSPGRFGYKRQNSSAAAALLGAREDANHELDKLNRIMGDLCIRAYNLWVLWLSDELSVIVSRDLKQDDALYVSTPWRGWEDLVVKQDQSDENQSALPSMPSPYIISFLFRACGEIHKVGGHVLDKKILQKLASSLLKKVIGIFKDFLSSEEGAAHRMSVKGVLQVLLDIKFATDVLSGGDSNVVGELVSGRREEDQSLITSAIRERSDQLLNRLSQRLDPIDWLVYKPYLWANARQCYSRHAVLFGFFVSLKRMYTDTVSKLPTNSENNISEVFYSSSFQMPPHQCSSIVL